MEGQIKELYQHFLQYPKVTTDTRKDVRDSLFFALSGGQFNGNEFAETALQKGAAFVVIDDPKHRKSDKHVLVGDTLKALQELAAYHRKRNNIHVFAITGTNGKTTTKELVAQLLQREKKIIFTRGNLNNHIGVPLTLLDIKPETEIAVVEMGANHMGEIAALCRIAQPDSGLITNIGKAHLEGFGSFKGVVSAKNELFEYLQKTNGHAIVNADDELLMDLSEGLHRSTYGNVSGDTKGSLLEVVPFIKMEWHCEGDEKQICSSHLYGRYNFNNLMAAAAVGCFFHVSANNINQELAAFVPQNNRSQQVRTAKNQLVLDAYNANPVSMREAITSFLAFKPENPWLILGDMFEMGKDSLKEHEKIIWQVQKSGLKNVIFIGKEFMQFVGTAGFLFIETTNKAADYLQNHPIEDAYVLLKGSRGMHLETLVKYL